MSEKPVRKEVWLPLIQELMSAIDSRQYSLSAEEVKNQLDTNPDELFNLIKERVNLPKGWLTNFSPDEEKAMASMLRSNDNYGEAVHRLQLKDGLTPIVICAALFQAEYRG